MDNLSDEQLVKRYLKGDPSALEILVRRYLKPLYNFVFKYMHTAAETEDVTQDAFLKIWKNLKTFNKKFKFKTWAYTIAKNTALDALKKKGLVPFSEMNDPDSRNDFAETLVDYRPLPEQALQQMENVELVSRAVAQLPEKYQNIVSLYYHQGLNFREIAESLRLSINTVKTRHRRALVYLKRDLVEK